MLNCPRLFRRKLLWSFQLHPAKAVVVLFVRRQIFGTGNSSFFSFLCHTSIVGGSFFHRADKVVLAKFFLRNVLAEVVADVGELVVQGSRGLLRRKSSINSGRGGDIPNRLSRPCPFGHLGDMI